MLYFAIPALLLISFFWAIISAKKKFGSFKVEGTSRKHLPRHGVIYQKK